MKKTYKWGEIDLRRIYALCRKGFEVAVNSTEKTLEFVKREPENIQTRSSNLIFESITSEK